MLTEENKKIWTIFNKKEEKLLRKKVADFNFEKHSKKEISDLVAFMRKMMIESRGVGLAANQIGLDMKVFVAQLPDKEDGGYSGKFYSIFNPKIVFSSEETSVDNEGCLSVPGLYGEVKRSNKIEVEGYDKNQRKTNIKASGYLARIFQHEIDHLNGKVFLDKAKKVIKIDDKTKGL